MTQSKGAGGINYSRINSSQHQQSMAESMADGLGPAGAPASGVSALQNSVEQSQAQPQGPFYRQVTIEAAEQFAKEENLVFLGETSCQDNINCGNLFEKLIA